MGPLFFTFTKLTENCNKGTPAAGGTSATGVEVEPHSKTESENKLIS